MSVQTQDLEDLVVKTSGNGGVASRLKTATAEREVIAKVSSKLAAPAAKSVQAKVTAEQLKAQIEARLRAAYEKAAAKVQPELAEPKDWWDLYAIGPIQPGAGYYGVDPPPFEPNRVIRVGEEAYIATILILNPFPLSVPPAGLIPAEVLSNFCLPYTIEYHTCDTTNCVKGPANLNVTHEDHLYPGVFFYVDLLHFVAEKEGCIFETNICGRILGCEYEGRKCVAPPFAGFVRWVADIDEDLFLGSEYLEFDNPVRFMVYE